MKAINKKIRLLLAMTLVGSSLMCMMENDIAQNNTVLFELSKRLRAKYYAVADTTYTHVTVEGLDGKTVNLNKIIHDLLKVETEQRYVYDQGIFNDTLYHALRLDLNRQVAKLAQQDIGVYDFHDVLQDVKFKFQLFSKLDRAQSEISDLVRQIEYLESKYTNKLEIHRISRMVR